MADPVCQGCGGSNQEIDRGTRRMKGTGKLCNGCRALLDGAKSLQERLDAYETGHGFAKISTSQWSWPRAYLPAMFKTQENEDFHALIETVRGALHVIANHMPTIGRKGGATWGSPKIVEGIDGWEEDRVVPRAAVLAYRAMWEAMQDACRRAYDVGKADGQEILARLARGELPVAFEDEKREPKEGRRAEDAVAAFKRMAEEGLCEWCFGEKSLDCRHCGFCLNTWGAKEKKCSDRKPCTHCEGTGKTKEPSPC